MTLSKSIYREFGAAILVAPVVVVTYNFLLCSDDAGYGQERYSVAFLLFFLFIYPVMEELIFRGMIQTILLKKTEYRSWIWKISEANAITSLLFAMVHLFSHSPLWAFLVFFPSLIFGYFRERYEHYYLNIILHIFYNFCALFFNC